MDAFQIVQNMVEAQGLGEFTYEALGGLTVISTACIEGSGRSHRAPLIYPLSIGAGYPMSRKIAYIGH